MTTAVIMLIYWRVRLSYDNYWRTRLTYDANIVLH